jgi:hypothetical protein
LLSGRAQNYETTKAIGRSVLTEIRERYEDVASGKWEGKGNIIDLPVTPATK